MLGFTNVIERSKIRKIFIEQNLKINYKACMDGAAGAKLPHAINAASAKT